MATDRVSLIHFDKLSMSPAAADRFQTALDALEALKLQDRYVYLVAPYLGDIAEAMEQGIRVVHDLLAAKSITKAKSDELCNVFENAAERVRAEMPA